MKISRDGWLPQLEPEGIAGPVLIRVGGAKRIIQQSSFPMQAVTMVNASISAWMGAYFTVILPGEQAWGQGQSQRTERSPLKRDTEEILARLERLETHHRAEELATDGGENS